MLKSLLSNSLRVGIPLLAAVLYAWHITPSLVRQLGYVPLGDSEQILLSHQNRSYRYRLSDTSGANNLGLFSQRLGWQDTFFTIETTVRIPRIEDLPSLSFFGNNGLQGALRLDASTDLDDRQRLSAFSAQGALSSFSGEIDGHVAGNDVVGHYKIAGGKETPFRFDGIDTSTRGGFSFVMALSPNLQSDDYFRSSSLGLSTSSPYLKQSYLDYHVGEAVEHPGLYGTAPCHEVKVSNEFGLVMTLFVDKDGVIHEALLNHLPLKAKLERILDEAGEQLWPLDKQSGFVP